jgi:O-antigen/teichoic acid export membrane protein
VSAAIGTGIRTSTARRGRSLSGNAALALGGDLASKGAQLAVFVAAARFLPISEVGLLGICLAAATLVTSFLDAGTSLVIARDGAAGGSPTGLLVQTARGRVPLLAAALLGATLVGLASGRLVAALLAFALGVLGATSLSLLAIYRAEQDLAVEAVQKLAAGVISLGAAALLMVQSPTCTAALVGLALGPAATLPSLVARQWTRKRRGPAPSGRTLLARALPFGAIALVTLAYYRAPTLALGALGTHAEVARYTLASTIGFGSLALANAITTGLLPRLASIAPAERPALARRALEWTLRIGVGTAALAVAGGPGMLTSALGPSYGAAFVPLVLLLGSSLLIGVSGIIGTVLTVEGRSGTLVRQVALALAANVGLALALAPRYGATGAACATVLTEVLALLVLIRAAGSLVEGISDRQLGLFYAACLALGAGVAAGGGTRILGAAAAIGLVAREAGVALPAARTDVARTTLVLGVGCFLVLDAAAVATSYGMRVISDTPTYLAIVQRLAETPFRSISVFMRAPTIDDPHATPYMQGIALLWRAIGGVEAGPRPVQLERMLQLVGVVVMVFVLYAFFVWVRRQTNRRTALVALPVLLLLFGPAHVIWAGDLTFHGFLYGAYFPQTVATGLLLWTLVALDGPPLLWRYLAGTACAAATFVVHPFTGTLLCLLVAASGSALALARRPGWELGSVSLALGYAIGSQWPQYSLSHALGQSGLQGPMLVGLCALMPAVALRLGGMWRVLRPGAERLARAVSTRGLALSVLGFGVTLLLAAWEVWLFTQPNPDPLVHSNHLSLYWVEDRWRWPLMYAAGAVGAAGLCRLAVRGKPLPLLWALGCLGIGTAGAAGMALPLWWRFLLFAQAPLALGAATWIAEAAPGTARRLVASTFAFTGTFKLVTLLVLPTTITYFGSALQDSYRLGSVIPRGAGAVAADPFTSYFVPGATGRSVLVVTKAHVASQDELGAAERGYALLHRFAVGSGWWAAAQQMYREGVRYVLIEKSTSLRAPDLVTFSTGPTPLVRTESDRRLLGTYYYRNNRVGTLVYDERPYTLYALSSRKLFGR